MTEQALNFYERERPFASAKHHSDAAAACLRLHEQFPSLGFLATAQTHQIKRDALEAIIDAQNNSL